MVKLGDAHDEGLELVEGEEVAQQAQVLLDGGEQEILQTAQRSRQGFSTGPVQFEVGGIQPALLQTLELEVDGEAQGFVQLGHLGWTQRLARC